MNVKNKRQVLTGLLIAMITTLLWTPDEARANAFQTTCFAEKEIGAAYEYQHFYIVDLSGAVTEYVYNSKGLLVEETDPLGAVTTYTYNELDRLIETVTPDGTVTSYTYTADGQVAEITARKVTGETEKLQYRYTAEGYLAAAISKATTDEYTYTECGEVASVTRNGTYRLELSYDEVGNLAELKELCLAGEAQTTVATYEYDAFHRMVKAVQDGVLLSEYGYDERGRLVYQTDGTGSITEYGYSEDSHLAFMETRTAEGVVLYREENSYNENGSVIRRAISGIVSEVGGTAGVFTYCYDESDRLVKEQGIYGTITYSYDIMGNRLTKTENGVTTYYTYDLCNKLVSENKNGEATCYIYDAMGNLIKKNAPDGTTAYAYDAFNQLERVTTPSGFSQENAYDAQGIRSALTENGTTTQYMTYNGIVLAAYNTAGERTEHYSYGKKILARE